MPAVADRYRRYQSVWLRRLQPGGRPRRRRRQARRPSKSGTSARIQEPRRPGRTGYAQHQDRPAAPAQVHARGRGGEPGHRRHHRPHREGRRAAQHPDAPGAAQHGEAAAAGHRRLDGRPRLSARISPRPQDRVQHLEYFYFHNFIYESVEEQPAPQQRTHRHLRPAASTVRTTRWCSSATRRWRPTKSPSRRRVEHWNGSRLRLDAALHGEGKKLI